MSLLMRGKRYRVVTKSYCIGWLLLGKPMISKRVYRWYWRARLDAAFPYRGIYGFEEKKVEPFYPSVEAHFGQLLLQPFVEVGRE